MHGLPIYIHGLPIYIDGLPIYIDGLSIYIEGLPIYIYIYIYIYIIHFIEEKSDQTKIRTRPPQDPSHTRLYPHKTPTRLFAGKSLVEHLVGTRHSEKT